MEHSRARSIAAFTGAVLVVAFFLPWIDLGGHFSQSGWDLALSEHVAWWTRVLIALVPLAGAGLMTSAATNGRHTRALAVASGVGILGYTGYEVARAFLSVTGYGVWILLAAALIAIVAGLALPRRS